MWGLLLVKQLKKEHLLKIIQLQAAPAHHLYLVNDTLAFASELWNWGKADSEKRWRFVWAKDSDEQESIERIRQKIQFYRQALRPLLSMDKRYD